MTMVLPKETVLITHARQSWLRPPSQSAPEPDAYSHCAHFEKIR